MENLTGMAVFAAVVDAKSFSAAAEQLGMSKSAVSKQVSRLEDRLGARLLNRTTRRLSLTEVGAVFYRHCVRVLEEAEAAEAAVTQLHGAARGRLRLNAPMSFGQMHLAPAISEFLNSHPDMSVDMDLTDRFVDLVEEGYDLAIRIAELEDSSLIARRLAPNNSVVCASPAYLKAHGRPSLPADLKAHNCLLYTNHRHPGEWRFQGAEGEMRVDVSGNFSANNGEVLRDAALDGVGITRGPTFILGPDLQAGRLVRLLADYCPAGKSAVHAVYPHKRHLSPKVRAFVDYLSARFAGTPTWDEGIARDREAGG